MKGKDLSALQWAAQDDPDNMSAYTATDFRGRGHTLVRNNHNPEMMFVISDGFKVVPGWYSDKDGAIRRVS